MSKSVLKKFTNTNQTADVKHNRNVSFNQTVIVFCEETEASTLSDQFEPPLGYQDPLYYNAFEPPENYCDHEAAAAAIAAAAAAASVAPVSTTNATTSTSTTTTTTAGSAPPTTTASSRARRDDAFAGSVTGEEADQLGANNKSLGVALVASADDGTLAGGQAATTLTEKQLLDLLEEKSLLGTFKLNCDNLSEGQFPLNRLNSSHGYMSTDAISDYDSDSESSFGLMLKDDGQLVNASTSTGNSIQQSENNSNSNSNSSCTNNYNNDANSGAESQMLPEKHGRSSKAAGGDTSSEGHQLRHQHLNANGASDSTHTTTTITGGDRAKAKSGSAATARPTAQSKSLPARMKVSTVDNSHFRRQTNRKEDPDLKPKQDATSATTNQQNNSKKEQHHQQSPHDMSYNQQQQQQYQHDDNRLSSAPVLIKQTTVEPVTLSKSIIVPNNKSNSADPSEPAKVPKPKSTTVNSSNESNCNSNQLNIDSVAAKQSKAAPSSLAPKLQQQQAPTETNQIIKDSTSVAVNNRETNLLLHQLPQLQSNHSQQPCLLQNTSATAVQAAASQNACHICRLIESNRSQQQQAKSESVKDLPSREEQFVNNVPIVSNGANHHHHHHQQPQQQQQLAGPQSHFQSIGSALASQQQPAIFDQSCVSCREASLKQKIAHNTYQLRAPGVGAAIRPVTYQLVYIVDQKGNRVRALTLARPALRAPGVVGTQQQQPIAGQRILIAQNGVRFPNPVSISTGQLMNASENLVAANSQLANNFATLNKGNPQQVAIAGSAIHNQAYSQVKQGQAHYLPNMSATTRPAYVANFQGVAVESLASRPHTVYYLRQPLNTQSIRQSFDSSGSATRSSFPDPHEIRRLDGLRGPTAALNLSSRPMDQNSASKTMVGRNPETGHTHQHTEVPTKRGGQNANLPPREEMPDDPTFGFSNRPSVKVVATTSPSQQELSSKARPYAQANESSIDQQRCNAANDVTSIHRNATNQTGVSLRPGSVIVLGSQTLDRRLIGQQTQYQVLKENIPSTSSMSNIHGTLAGYNNAIGKVSAGANANSSILSSKDSNSSSNNSKLKEFAPSELDNNIRLECNDAVISNNRVAPLATQGRQVSSLTEQTVTLDQIRRAKLEHHEVAFSMNI